MPLAALEALLDPTSDAAVRALWAALDAAGLPSQAQHRGASNAPHLTLVTAPRLEDGQLIRALDLLGPLIPATVEVSGQVVFGEGARHTMALLCTVPATMSAAVGRLSAEVDGGGGRAWVPHLTLSRRLSAAQVGAALEVLGDQRIPMPSVTLAQVRHWDPVTRSARTLTGCSPPGSAGPGRR